MYHYSSFPAAEKATRERRRGTTPYLIVRDASRAIDFYKKASERRN